MAIIILLSMTTVFMIQTHFNIANVEGNFEHDQEFINKNVRIKVDED